MSTPLLDYLKKSCLDLIQEEQFAELYKRVLKERGYSSYIGELTELLYECGGNPVDDLTEIPSRFLTGVTKVTNIKLIKKNKTINSRSFSDCPSLETIDLSNLFTRLPNKCFENSTNLKSVTGIDSVRCIDTDCFRVCSSLEEIHFNKELMYIAPGAFVASGLKSITIESDCTVCSTAFSKCTSLTTAVLGAYMLKNNAFSKCTSLTDVTLTNPSMTLDKGVFSDCSSLTSVKFTGTKAEWNKLNKYYEWRGNAPIAVVYCSDGDIKLKV